MKPLTILFFLSFVLVLCTSNKVHKDRSNGYINVDPLEFKEMMENRGSIILDIRTPQEIAQGHIQDAISIDYYDSDFIEKLEQLPKDKPVYIYCRTGRRSSEAAKIMMSAGFKDVVHLDGGITAWQRKGLPIVSPAQ